MSVQVRKGEMTLEQWCRLLPRSHRVNAELAALRNAYRARVDNPMAFIGTDNGVVREEVEREQKP